MKTRKIIYLVASVAMFSCGTRPTADFTYSPVNPTAGETVYFTNKSENAKSYSWNFGNMAIGSDANPSHVYEQAGSYIVDLTPSKGAKSDTKTITLVVTD